MAPVGEDAGEDRPVRPGSDGTLPPVKTRHLLVASAVAALVILIAGAVWLAVGFS